MDEAVGVLLEAGIEVVLVQPVGLGPALPDPAQRLDEALLVGAAEVEALQDEAVDALVEAVESLLPPKEHT